jgi:CubicO group peptidase (beta-lactamase class C family)
VKRSRWGRRLVAGAVGLVVVLGPVYGAAHLLTGRYAWARAVAWMESDVDDQFRFPARTVPAGETVSELSTGPEREKLRSSVDDLIHATGTRAFLVVHRDRVVVERYLDGATARDRQTSFSMAKSVLSTLVGIAVDDGLLSLDEPVTTYLPELAERDPAFSAITLRNLLTMASGIRYREDGMPWSDDALTYYGTDLRELALTRPRVEGEPGERWLYNNFHPLLLGLVLERVTGTTLSDFTATRLWQPLGAEADATWSLDSERSGFEKLESGVNARPRDFARLGLMMLHEGRWNGHRVVSEKWVREATAASTATDPAPFYQYLWWVGPDDPDGTASYFARGKYGQTIGVFPDEDVVIVRLGTTDAGVDWPARLQELATQVVSGR